MIYGIGTDIVNIERVQTIILKNRDGFIKRVLTEHEQALFANKADSPAFLAKRFAAKEAFSKALGTGKPYFLPSEKLRLYLLEKGIKQGHLSISDESQNAVAFVVLEKLDSENLS